jgi:hypothetical protein
MGGVQCIHVAQERVQIFVNKEIIKSLKVLLISSLTHTPVCLSNVLNATVFCFERKKYKYVFWDEVYPFCLSAV